MHTMLKSTLLSIIHKYKTPTGFELAWSNLRVVGINLYSFSMYLSISEEGLGLTETGWCFIGVYILPNILICK